MLNERHLATIQAALRYWLDEMSPFEPSLVQSYFHDPSVHPLSTTDVIELIQVLKSCEIRRVRIDRQSGQILEDSSGAQAATDPKSGGTGIQGVVLLPKDFGK